jgi:hypothetical protein
MQKLTGLTIFFALLAGCASLTTPPVLPGQPQAEVEARLGRPTAVYRDGADTELEYAWGPAGQYTYMARFGPDGRLRSYEQVLTSARFAQVRIGIDDRDSILRSFGRPAQITTLARPPYEVWGYRYKEQGVWNSMMYVHFDPAGVVRKMVNGPDPEHEEHEYR